VVTRGETDRISFTREAIVFDGTTGAILSRQGGAGPAEASWGALYGLHLARFAGPGLRALFFLSGLVGTGMVATGLLLWVAKRRAGAGRGWHVVERVNVGVMAGLPVAMVALLWANRLLPAGLPGREAWEMRSFFGAWLAMLVWAALRPARRAWPEVLGVAALLCAGLPALNAATTEVGLGSSLRAGDWAVAGIDLGVLAVAPAFAMLAWIAARGSAGAVRRPRPVPAGSP
jgi:uncharacterized iron-regulated membrane protein